MLKVLINQAGGKAAAAGDALADKVRSAFAEAGAEVDVMMLDGAALQSAVRALVGKEKRIVVAGGDGTISCAAALLVGSDTELAILPLGTLNHLAGDAGIPADMIAAAHVAVHGHAQKVDTGRLGQRTYVNNASIGLYPMMVRQREAEQRRGLGKWRAAIPAAWSAFRKLPVLTLEISALGPQRAEPLRVTTPLLFVGNNQYSLKPGSVGRRASLTQGKLSLFAVRHCRRVDLAWFALRFVLGRTDRAADFVAIGDFEALQVNAMTPVLDVALDGELLREENPLRFSIQPASLSLVMPPAHEE